MTQAVLADFKPMGSRLHHKPVLPLSGNHNHAPSAHTAAVVTFAADSERKNVITSLIFGYSGTTPLGSIKVEDGSGTTVFGPIPVAGQGTWQILFDPPLAGSTNTALIVTLADGGAAATGALYVNGYREN